MCWVSLAGVLGVNGENPQVSARFPSEAEAVAAAREQLLKPLAEKRRREHGDTAPGRPANTSAKLAEETPEPRPRDAAATGLGYGRTTLAKVREVRKVAETNETGRSTTGGVERPARQASGELQVYRPGRIPQDASQRVIGHVRLGQHDNLVIVDQGEHDVLAGRHATELRPSRAQRARYGRAIEPVEHLSVAGAHERGRGVCCRCGSRCRSSV